MITTVTNDKCYEFRGLSTDPKPTGERVGNGSIFFSMDDCKVYAWDSKGKQWIELK